MKGGGERKGANERIEREGKGGRRKRETKGK